MAEQQDPNEQIYRTGQLIRQIANRIMFEHRDLSWHLRNMTFYLDGYENENEKPFLVPWQNRVLAEKIETDDEKAMLEYLVTVLSQLKNQGISDALPKNYMESLEKSEAALTDILEESQEDENQHAPEETSASPAQEPAQEEETSVAIVHVPQETVAPDKAIVHVPQPETIDISRHMLTMQALERLGHIMDRYNFNGMAAHLFFLAHHIRQKLLSGTPPEDIFCLIEDLLKEIMKLPEDPEVTIEEFDKAVALVSRVGKDLKTEIEEPSKKKSAFDSLSEEEKATQHKLKNAAEEMSEFSPSIAEVYFRLRQKENESDLYRTSSRIVMAGLLGLGVGGGALLMLAATAMPAVWPILGIGALAAKIMVPVGIAMIASGVGGVASLAIDDRVQEKNKFAAYREGHPYHLPQSRASQSFNNARHALFLGSVGLATLPISIVKPSHFFGTLSHFAGALSETVKGAIHSIKDRKKATPAPPVQYAKKGSKHAGRVLDSMATGHTSSAMPNIMGSPHKTGLGELSGMTPKEIDAKLSQHQYRKAR